MPVWQGIFLGFFLAVLLLPYVSGFPSILIEDDGFFYAKIAKQIALTGVSTFDGINETSGYHLLWMGVLVVVSKIAMAISDTAPFVLYCDLAVCLSITLFVIQRFFKNFSERVTAFVLFCVCSFLTEMTLVVVFLLVFFHWYLRFCNNRQPHPPQWYVYAVLVSIPIARIDSVAILSFPVLYLAYVDRKIFVKTTLAVVLGLAMHFFTMWFAFDNLFSVSSMLKAGGLEFNLANNLVHRGIGYTLRNLAVIAFIGSSVYICIAKRDLSLGAVVAGVVSFYAIHLVLSDQRHWYFLPTFIPLLYITAKYKRSLPFSRGFEPALLALSLVFVSGYGLSYQLDYSNDRVNSVYFITKVNELLQEGEVIFQIDGAGYAGFFIASPIINGDGLVNSYAYAEKLKSNRLAGYLEEANVSYIITNQFLPKDAELLVDFHGLKVNIRDVDLVFAVPFDGKNRYSNFALYKLKWH